MGTFGSEHLDRRTALLVSLGLIVMLMLSIPLRAETGAEANPASAPDLIIYYFHGDVRCNTCLLLEDLTVAVVRDSLGERLASGSLALEVVNYHREETAHFIADFNLQDQSVVLARYAKGERLRWKALPRIWDLYDRPDDFNRYLLSETAAFLEAE